MIPSNPLVSVIIPAFNAQSTIFSTLESVLSQTFREFEVIVVDDGSTDDTASIVQRIPDERLIYLHQPNQERAIARNRGIAHARGRYLAFLDADDLWLETKLEKQVALIEADPELGLVYCDLYYANPNHQELVQYSQKYHQLYRGWIFNQLLRVAFIQSPTPLVRRSVFDHADWFDTSVVPAEDWDAWLRISVRYPIDYVPEPLATYRFHPYLNYWQKNPEQMLLRTKRIFKKLADQYPAEVTRYRASYRRGLAMAHYNYGLANMLNGNLRSAWQGYRMAIRTDATFWKTYIRAIHLAFILARQISN